jgi:hypothetical protein
MWCRCVPLRCVGVTCPVALHFGMSADSNLIAINVGNTRTAIARFEDGRLAESQRFANSDADAIVHVLASWRGGTNEGDNAEAGDADAPRAGALDDDVPIVVASVNDPMARTLIARIERGSDTEVYRVGEDVAVPASTITHACLSVS